MVFRSLIPHRTNVSLRPFRGFGDFFDDAGFGARFAPVRASEFAPHVDVQETDEAVRVIAELPGLDAKDFEVTLDEDVLTIKGEKSTSGKDEGEGYTHVERSSGSFQRSFRIPWELAPESVTANYKNGVLTVTVPRPEESHPEPRTITVETS